MAEHSPIKELTDQLGRIFRHLLPGVLILAAARASHPRWFIGRFDWGAPWQLALLATVAVLVGNTWYVAHRYTFHQLLDVLFSWKARGRTSYTEWLAKHVHDSNLFPPHAEDLRQHILFRSAQVIYLFILGEVLLFFAWRPAMSTVVARYRVWLLVGGVIVVAFACWQYFLSHRIDRYAVAAFGGKRAAQQPVEADKARAR